MRRFEGRVALVTGAGRGIGRAAAGRLARARVRVCPADSAIMHFASGGPGA